MLFGRKRREEKKVKKIEEQRLRRRHDLAVLYGIQQDIIKTISERKRNRILIPYDHEVLAGLRKKLEVVQQEIKGLQGLS